MLLRALAAEGAVTNEWVRMKHSGAALGGMSALLLLALGTLVGLFYEGGPVVRLEQFGFEGPTVYVAAVGSGGEIPKGLNDRVREYALTNGLSVVFTPAESGLVTLFDPTMQVSSPSGPIYGALERVSSGASASESGAESAAALISLSVNGLNHVLAAGGTEIEYERFDFGGIAFRGYRPVVVVNSAAQPFGHGYYLFLGAADPAAITSMLTAARMDILQLESQTSLPNDLKSPFIVAALVALLSLLICSAITALVRAWSARSRLSVMAILGARRRRLSIEVVRQLLPPIAAGGAAGAGILALAQLAAAGFWLNSAMGQVGIWATTVGLAAVCWTTIVGAVVWIQVKWCRCAHLV